MMAFAYNRSMSIFLPLLRLRYTLAQRFQFRISPVFRRIHTLPSQNHLRETSELFKIESFSHLKPLSHKFTPENSVLQRDQVSFFIENFDDWFKHMQSIVDNHPDRVNSAGVLAELGQINRWTNGDLSAKFDDNWSPIEYFMQAMLSEEHGGFNRYQIEDIVRALAGIRDFAAYSKNPISARSIFNSWLEEFATCIRTLGPKDSGYCFLERRSSYVLFLLSGLSPIQKIPPDLLYRLCHLSKLSFDQRLRDKGSNAGADTNISDEISCFYYSDAFLYWLHDPNSIVPKSWKTWYDICRLIFESRLKELRNSKEEFSEQVRTIRLISRYVSVAAEFDTVEEFWANFSLWKRILMECLYRYCSPSASRKQGQELDDIRLYLPDLVYNLGLLVNRSGHSGDQYRNRFEHMLPMLDNALANLGIKDGISHCRVLTGFRNLARRTGDFELSIGYYRMIKSWCQVSRKNSSKDTPKLANTAATIMFILREMKLRQYAEARLKTLEELVLLFDHCLDGLEDIDLNRALSYFGDACLNLEIDPRRICGNYGPQDIWCRYFEKAQHYLENRWPTEANIDEPKKLLHALSILADVAYRYRREEEFRQIYPIYEERLMTVMHLLTASQSFYLHRTLSKMRLKGFAVNENVLVGLAKKAEGFGPRSGLLMNNNVMHAWKK